MIYLNRLVIHVKNHITLALAECIQEINCKLKSQDEINKEISIIQIESALNTIDEMLKKNNINLDNNTLNRYKKISCFSRKCITISRCLKKIQNVLYKEVYLSEEVCRYVMDNLKYIAINIDKILEDNILGPMFLPYIIYVRETFNEYLEYLRQKIINKKIK